MFMNELANNLPRNEISDVYNFLQMKGIEIVGIASMNNKSLQKQNRFHPQEIQENAKSVICYAIPIPKGIILSKSYELLLYWRYCNMSYRTLDEIANSLCVYLEEQKYIATPIYGCYPWKINNNEFSGLSHLVYWAEEAGIGKITKSGLLGHPKYGTRILLGGVITSRVFPKPKILEEDLCPNDCSKCIDSCPINAISPSGKVDHNLCIRYSSKNPLMALALKDMSLKKKYEFERLLNTIAVDDHGTYECLECLKVCPLNSR